MREEVNAERFFEDVPADLLEQMYDDQKRALKEMGVDIPDEDIFDGQLPLWRKVMLLDWLLREALSGADGFKAH